MLTAIRQWVIKTMMKNNTGVVQTLPKRDLIELNTQITAQRLMQNGVDPESLTNVNQVENVINQIDNPPKINIDTGRNQSGIRSTKSAKVFNTAGEELDSSKPIIGGTQPGKKIDQDTFKRLAETNTQRIKQRISDKKVETEAEIAARMNRENKEAAQRIRDRKADEKQFNKDVEEAGGMEEFLNKNPIDDAIDNASPGFAGDIKYDAELVAEDLAERMGLVYDDLPTKQRLDLYDQAYQGLSKQRFKNRPASEDRAIEDFVDDAGGVDPDDPRGIDDFIPDPEDMAQGGRAGFSNAGHVGHTEGVTNAMLKHYKKYLNTRRGKQKKIIPLRTFAEGFFKENLADGGRAGLKSGASKAFLEFLKKFKVKQSGDDVKDFLSKRQFMKDIVGNTKENEKARQLTMLKEMAEEYQKKKFGKFEFPSDEQIKIDLEKRIQPILNKGRKLNSDGGRIGLKAGMTKRAFLKLMGTGAAGIAALKSGILGLGKGAGKQVAEEVVKKSTSTPPAYFFELAEKIKTLGRVTDGPQERIKIHSMPAKDGKSELMLTEDIGTGEMQIKKIGKEEDMTTKVETMEYTPGSSQADETTQGIPPDSYDEYTEVNSRIYKDEFNEPDIIDGIEVDEIIEEVKDQAPSIKKAGGGIARMLGE